MPYTQRQIRVTPRQTKTTPDTVSALLTACRIPHDASTITIGAKSLVRFTVSLDIAPEDVARRLSNVGVDAWQSAAGPGCMLTWASDVVEWAARQRVSS